MSRAVKRSIILLLLILDVAVGRCQMKDAQLWMSASFQAKVVKKLTASVTQEVRLNENLKEFGTLYTDLGLEYKISKHFQASVNYRFVQKKQTDNSYSYRHRPYLEIKADYTVKPFVLKYRCRIQDEYNDMGRAEDGGRASYDFRNRFSLEWDHWKKYTPYVSVELFTPLNDDYPLWINDIRGAAGLEISLSKHHKLDLFYLIQHELYVSKAETDFVLGFGYAYKL